MAPSTVEQLTTQFYEWEQLGRGWIVYDFPVDIEPPFHPFFFHTPPPTHYIDDGKRLTLLGKLVTLFQREKTSIKEEVAEFSIHPYQDKCNEPLVATSISIPPGYKTRAEEMEQLLLMISYCKYQVSFEIIATSTSIHLQFVTRDSDQQLLSSQLKAYFPSCICTAHYSLDEIINGDLEGTIVDFGVSEEFMRPLAMVKGFDLDPFTGLFGILEHLNGEDRVVVQVLFKGAENPWTESIMRSVMDDNGGAFFMDAPDMLPLAKEKISCPLFGVTVRVLGQSEQQDRATNIALDLSNALSQLSSSNANKLIPLSNEGYDSVDYVSDLVERQSHRLGMLLNSRELANLVHLPSPSIVSSKLVRKIKKTKAAPEITTGNDFVLGSNIHQGEERIVSVNSAQRLKHTHIIGATGTGKSTFLLNLIAEDIQNGNGVAAIDPHGDLIENILEKIPSNRIDDVIIIDPADSEYPVGFNILKAHSEIEKEILSSDLVAAFKRLSTSWGDQMNSVFANAILAFLESTEGGTLMDLRRFLIEKPFRDSFLKTVTDSHVIYYWQKEFPILKSTSIGPILTRLDTFLRPKLIRNMVAQNKSVDLEAILDTKKILLVKLSQGLIGNENSFLLGTFIVSRIHQAAMARQAKAKEARSDFFLYIDEFQNFITPSMSAILSGARKYHLGLILAHQDMQQLLKYDSELASSVVANAGTRICFRLGDTDAKKFESGFSYFDAKDLQSLNIGEAIARIDRPDCDFNLSILQTSSGSSYVAKDITISHSREKYGSPRSIVEGIIQQPALIQKESLKVEYTNTEAVKPVTTLEMLKSFEPITEEKLVETKEKLVEKKEQSEHRYLQSLIKRMAELRGYKATIEQPTPDGKGRVDVLLERNSKTISCEISVTTTENWEVHNIEKCLNAGFDIVVVCSNEKENLVKIRNKCTENFSENELLGLLFFQPEDLFSYLDQQIANETISEKRFKGYRVKVKYSPITESEAKQKKDAIIKTVTESLKKKGK